MTKLLRKAFEKAKQLTDEEQNEIASLMLAEMESDRRWTEAFSKSQKQLLALAEEALSEHRKGETDPIDDSD